jgi:hypothetical protein
LRCEVCGMHTAMRGYRACIPCYERVTGLTVVGLNQKHLDELEARCVKAASEGR